MRRVVWVVVVVSCLLVLWARYPADASCEMVRGYVQSYGMSYVRDRALQLGYTHRQIKNFRAHCRRQGVRF